MEVGTEAINSGISSSSESKNIGGNMSRKRTGRSMKLIVGRGGRADGVDDGAAADK